jgi:hypothetical protein
MHTSICRACTCSLPQQVATPWYHTLPGLHITHHTDADTQAGIHMPAPIRLLTLLAFLDSPSK